MPRTKKEATPSKVPSKAIKAHKLPVTKKETPIISAKKIGEKKKDYFYGVGKRKAAIAQVRLYPKGGEIKVNDKDWQNYFSYFELQKIVVAPLELVGQKELLSANIKVYGGGFRSQAEAVRHGLTRALIAFDETLKPTLRAAGYVTRDPRVKERKKPGLKRARRAPQFSKR